MDTVAVQDNFHLSTGELFSVCENGMVYFAQKSDSGHEKCKQAYFSKKIHLIYYPISYIYMFFMVIFFVRSNL